MVIIDTSMEAIWKMHNSGVCNWFLFPALPSSVLPRFSLFLSLFPSMAVDIIAWCYGFLLSERELGKNMIEIEGKTMNKGSWRDLSLLQTMGSSRGRSSLGLTRVNILSFHIFLLHSMRFYRRVPSATSFPARTFLPTDYC
jgi:hypothetical protein